MVPKESDNHKSCGVTPAKHLPLSPWATSTSSARHRSKGDLARAYHGNSCRRENPKAKLFPPAGADGRAAKPSSEMFKEHKSRRRGERWHRGTAARRKYLLFKCSLIQPGRYNETARLLHRTYARERRSLPLHPRRGAGAAPGYPEDTLPGTKGWAESRCGRSCFTLNKLLRSQAGFVPRPAGTRPLRPRHSCPPCQHSPLLWACPPDPFSSISAAFGRQGQHEAALITILHPAPVTGSSSDASSRDKTTFPLLTTQTPFFSSPMSVPAQGKSSCCAQEADGTWPTFPLRPDMRCFPADPDLKSLPQNRNEPLSMWLYLNWDK